MRKIFYVVLFMLMCTSMAFMTSCDKKKPGKDDNTPTEVTPTTPGDDTPTTPGDDDTPTIPSDDDTPTTPTINVSMVTFESKTFTYTGEAFNLECKNVPEGVLVTYLSNGKKEVGSYVVTAVLTDTHANKLKQMEATLTIVADTPSIDVSKVTFKDLTVTYTGAAFSIECENVPEGVTVSYTGNSQTEVGVYTVKATLKDSLENTLKELTATLTIEAKPVDPDEPVVPTTGMYIVINGTDYYALTKNTNPIDPSYTEYKVLGITFKAGDVITLYDADNKASWAITKPDSYSAGKWTGSKTGITCGEAGTFDVYVKMKYQADEIYFSKSA